MGEGTFWGPLSVWDCFWGENSCVQKTLQKKKKEAFKNKHARGKSRGVEDEPAVENRGRNTNRKGPKTALSLPKKY
jgi:hypothetical protein